MPNDAISQRLAVARFESHRARYVSEAKLQEELNKISSSQARRGPSRCCPLAAIYVTALVLPHLSRVTSSAAYFCESSSLQAEQDGAVLPSLSEHLPEQKIGTISCVRTPCPGEGAARKLEIAAPVARRLESVRKECHSAITSGLLFDPLTSKRLGFFGHLFAEAAIHGSSIKVHSGIDTEKIFILENESDKGAYINALRIFLMKSNQLPEKDANRLEFLWRQRAAGAPIYIASLTEKQIALREKRISHANREGQIAEHIKETCAFETEILSSEGLSEGQLLIFKAQTAENPMRTLFNSDPNSQYSDTWRTLENGIDFFFDIITIGIKPFISQQLANFYRHRYYKGIGDEICATRQLHLGIATIVTSLDIEALSVASAKRNPLRKLVELTHTPPYKSRATYFSTERETGIQIELLMKAFSSDSPENDTEKVLLKPKGESEFVTFSPDSDDLKKSERSVIFNHHENSWNYADSTNTRPLTLEIEEGETLISIHDKQFPLKITNHNQPTILVKSRTGEDLLIPVYRNPLSKLWHLETSNYLPTFSQPQKKLISRLKIAPDKKKRYREAYNDDPITYGDGKLFHVTNRDDNMVQYSVIEMSGNLVPVRRNIIKGHVIYEAYDRMNLLKKGISVEWNGDHWLFENWTSRHISHALKRKVSPDMFAHKIDASQLLPPDHQGVRRDERNVGYIKIKKHFVQIHQEKHSFLVSPSGRKIPVFFREDQFHSEEDAFPAPFSEISSIRAFSENFLSALIDPTTHNLPMKVYYQDIVNTMSSLFPSERTRIEAIPSSDLKKRRLMVSVGDRKYFIETSIDRENIHFLEGEKFNYALSKFNDREFGGSIQHVLGLARKNENVQPMPQTPFAIRQITHQRIQAGYSLVKDALEKHNAMSTGGKKIILGNEDFFFGATVANNAYASISATFEDLMHCFISLSKSYPDVIIAPGSIYISQYIPAPFRLIDLSYTQENSEGKVHSAVKFSASLAPVFYAGKLVTIARKGDFLRRYASPQTDGKFPDGSLAIPSLDIELGRGEMLVAPNYRENKMDDLVDTVRGRIGAIFSGKTLLPGERELAETYLRPHFVKGNTVDVQDIFSNEFAIDGEKFLLIIGDECKTVDDVRPATRNLALPQMDTFEEANRYDWILHSSSEDTLDEAMRSVGDNYLKVADNENNAFISETFQRTEVKGDYPDQHFVLYDYSKN